MIAYFIFRVSICKLTSLHKLLAYSVFFLLFLRVQPGGRRRAAIKSKRAAQHLCKGHDPWTKDPLVHTHTHGCTAEQDMACRYCVCVCVFV